MVDQEALITQEVTTLVLKEQQEHQVYNQVAQALERLVPFANCADAIAVETTQSISYHVHSVIVITGDTYRAIVILHP
jgi:ubiquinone biosynthesis protein COQ9